MTIINGLLALFCIGILASCVLCIVWFLWAMMVSFYTIYFKKPKKKPCSHPSFRYTDLDPLKPWTCSVCKMNSEI
jgi:hypothetical protein